MTEANRYTQSAIYYEISPKPDVLVHLQFFENEKVNREKNGQCPYLAASTLELDLVALVVAQVNRGLVNVDDALVEWVHETCNN